MYKNIENLKISAGSVYTIIVQRAGTFLSSRPNDAYIRH